MNPTRWTRYAACLLLTLVSRASAQVPLGSAINYQGVLKLGGVPATGTFNLRFQLWDALTGGTQVGADIDLPTVAVTDGLFTVELNFGTLVFSGTARWLQVQVITNGGSTVTTLAPRQAVTAAPYALFALAAEGSNVTNLNASNIASGSLSTARLPVGGAWALSSNLNFDANTLVVDQANNRLGIGVADPGAKLDVQAANSSNVLFGRRTGGGLSHNLYIDGSGNGAMQLIDAAGATRVEMANGLTYFNYGNFGIGTTAPLAPLHLRGTAPFMVIQDNASAANQAGYIGFWNNLQSETGWMGFGSPGSQQFSIVNARSAGDIRLIPGTNGSVDVIGEATVSTGLTVGEFLIVTDDGALAAFNRTVTDGALIDFQQNGTIEGTISVTGTTVSYGAFTGCHYGWSDHAIERGTLVVMTGENRRRIDEPGDEPIYGIEPSVSPNDPRCLGAYLGVREPAQPASLDNPHQIMAVGNGDMWVVESGAGDIKPGDYLISSDVKGHAMLDDPKRFPIGHVVARAAEAVHWNNASGSVGAGGQRRQRISVFFQSFERGSEADVEISALRAEVAELKALVRQLTSSSRN